MTETDPHNQAQAIVQEHLRLLLDDAGSRDRITAYLLRLSAGGWGNRQLGDLLGVSREAVRQRLAQARADGLDVDALAVHLEVPPPPPVQRVRRPKVGLPIPDVQEITAAARARTDALLSKGDDITRIVAASKEVNRASGEIKQLRRWRATLAWSLTCYDRAPGIFEAGLWDRNLYYTERKETLGLDGKQFKAMSDEDLVKLAETKKIRRVSDAAAQYYQVVCDLVDAEATYLVALDVRNELMLPVREAVGLAETARLIGRSAKLVEGECRRQRLGPG